MELFVQLEAAPLDEPLAAHSQFSSPDEKLSTPNLVSHPVLSWDFPRLVARLRVFRFIVSISLVGLAWGHKT